MKVMAIEELRLVSLKHKNKRHLEKSSLDILLKVLCSTEERKSHGFGTT